MIRIGAVALLGTLATCVIARRQAESGFVQRAEIDRTLGGQAREHLRHVLTRLVHVGVLGSVRGAGGGYYLAREPQSVTLREILRAFEGVHDAEVAAVRLNDEPSLVVLERIIAKFNRLAKVMARGLDELTIEALVAAEEDVDQTQRHEDTKAEELQ